MSRTMELLSVLTKLSSKGSKLIIIKETIESESMFWWTFLLNAWLGNRKSIFYWHIRTLCFLHFFLITILSLPVSLEIPISFLFSELERAFLPWELENVLAFLSLLLTRQVFVKNFNGFENFKLIFELNKRFLLNQSQICKLLELNLQTKVGLTCEMISDTVVFGFTLIDTGAVLFLLIYFVSFNKFSQLFTTITNPLNRFSGLNSQRPRVRLH